MNTGNAELGRTIQTQEIENLPLVERNVFALLDLTPGVQSNNAGISNTAQGNLQSTLGFPEQRTLINGGTDGGTGSVNYFLDGGTNMTNLRNTGNVAPNPEAVREFKVTTNAYGGGLVDSRVGSLILSPSQARIRLTARLTNMCEMMHLTPMNGIRYWRRRLTDVINLAARFGGPIIEVKHSFFGTYSGLRQNTSRFLSGATLPSAAFRTGDFTPYRQRADQKIPRLEQPLPTPRFFQAA